MSAQKVKINSNPASEEKSAYGTFLQDIKQRIREGQYQALKAVNQQLIRLYWDIGEMIVGRQERHGWGKSVVENLSRDLRLDFPGISGYSSDNLWRMRKFYLFYKEKEKLAPLVQEISWSKNIVIMESCENDLEREFYIRMTRRMGWSKNVLTHQIDNKAYEKTLTSHTNFDKALPKRIKNQAKLAVKDEYTFDFLELEEEHSELELERALMGKISRFLAEMGGTFAFVGNQFRLEVDEQEFFIDILLYHRRLKCLVAVELKTGAFKPEYAGKMQFYLSALDDLEKQKGENPSIGIILCRDKRKTIVEYTLRQSKTPIGVGKYKIVEQVPQELKKELPSPAQVELLLQEI